ncbi:alpha-L-rhamnosidase [Candidatus Galacturonibacter soehngenii]|uniref:alpha-L-rhamnosidase n=1 Tax=Candidatus Galacturonatibacter soehngenii TaxID=2307010 RepID=A0A7V7QLH3_9FIRM|nr:alpha-L-rhamnosidase [Candidatus Galacturonibacter soehngenii]KAB1438681.1 Bacterial alpha-L-rhamnosidase [Candidatus Galacturonibacter soehngenii]MBA4685721.1 family 78 glycoside hydrolase catalytic domain [Candidatus Galacturonibacter soehngenii]
MRELRENFITSPDVYKEGAVAVFRQKFNVKPIKSASILITALGMYEAELNGEKIGKQMYAPGYTYYPRRLLYQEHDVTSMVQSEENELKVYLGQGWYCGRFLCENKTQIYGKKPGVSWVLKITCQDGSIEEIHSGTNVEELESPYEYAGEYDGEIYFAGKFNKVKGYAVPYKEPIPESLEKTLVEVQVHEEMPVKEVSKLNGVTILDFGQNFAGIVEIDPQYIAGETLTIRHGEILNPNGSLYTNNLRKAKATIIYHAGVEKKKYRPRFTYMGFRYMEISGVEYKSGMITAYAVYSHMERTGNFNCANKLVQKLYENQVWGQKSNYVEVPTDCPQRDERMGYTGDGQVFALTGAYNFNTQDFWKNFLVDLRLGQKDNSEGYVCATVPATGPAGIGFMSMLGWGNAVTILPEMLYWQYGDEETLLGQYNSMKLFVEAEIRKMGKKNLWIGPSLGDWLAPGKGIAWQAMHNGPISNAFIVHDLEVITKVAKRLGKQDDALRYENQLEKTRKAYIRKYVRKDGQVARDYQSAYIMALKYVIPKGELREKTLKKYVKNVKKKGIETGFFATQHFLSLLIEAGESKLAYDMLLQENCPGWMYQVLRGATTTWERWDALKPDGTVNEEKMPGSGENMVSFNHYAFGSVGEFYYQYILGIRPMLPGYEKLHFEPYTDKRLGHVNGSYMSCKGEIKSEWFYEKNELLIRLTTPVEAEIVLEDGRKEQVTPGTHEYQIKAEKVRNQ